MRMRQRDSIDPQPAEPRTPQRDGPLRGRWLWALPVLFVACSDSVTPEATSPSGPLLVATVAAAGLMLFSAWTPGACAQGLNWEGQTGAFITPFAYTSAQ